MLQIFKRTDARLQLVTFCHELTDTASIPSATPFYIDFTLEEQVTSIFRGTRESFIDGARCFLALDEDLFIEELVAMSVDMSQRLIISSRLAVNVINNM